MTQQQQGGRNMEPDDLWEEGDAGAKGLEDMLQYYYIKKKEGRPSNRGASGAKEARGRSNSLSASPQSPKISPSSSAARITASPLRSPKPTSAKPSVEPVSPPTITITPWKKTSGDELLGNQGATSSTTAEQSTNSPGNATMGTTSPGGGINKKRSHRLKTMVLGSRKEAPLVKSHTAPMVLPSSSHHTSTTTTSHSNTTTNHNNNNNGKPKSLEEDEAKLLLDHLKKCDEELLKCDLMIKEIDEKEQKLLDRMTSPSSSSSSSTKSEGMYNNHHSARASKRPEEELKKEMHIVEAFLDHFASSDRAKRSTISRGLMVTALEDYQSPENPRFQFKKGTNVHLLDVDSKGKRYQGVIRDPSTQKNEIAWFPVFFIKVMPPSRRDQMKQRSIRRTEKKERNSSVMQELIRQAEASNVAKRKATTPGHEAAAAEDKHSKNGHDQASSSKAKSDEKSSETDGQTLVVALDGSKDAFQALECCVRFANKGDKIYMVYVIEKHKEGKAGNKKEQLRWNQQLQENKLMADLLMVQAKESANEATTKFHKKHVAVKGRVKTAVTNKAECLCNLATTYKANYIFAGAGGDGSSIIISDGGESGGSGKGSGKGNNSSSSSTGNKGNGSGKRGSGGSSSGSSSSGSKGSGSGKGSGISIIAGGIGNTSRYLLAHAQCPVIICRDEKS